MNANALQVYSVLMRHEIPFIRYCHSSYKTPEQWQKLLQRSGQAVIIPRIVPSYQPETGHFLLHMLAPQSPLPAGDDALSAQQLESLISLLRCTPHTISPLGMIFDTAHQCRLELDPALAETALWALSPCSDQSSVLITPEAFREKLLRVLLDAA